MKVLVVTPWFPSELKPGAGSFVLKDVELLERDHEVTVLHLAESRDVRDTEAGHLRTEGGSRVLRQRFNPLSPLSLVQARSMIGKLLDDADVVHTMAMHALLPVRLARPRIPWVHTEHWSGLMLPSLPLKKQLGLVLYRSSLSKPDAVVAVGEALASNAERYTAGEVRIIPNHVPLGTHDRLPPPPEARGDTPLKLIAVGNMIDHKGPIIALESVKVLRTRGIPSTLCWVGSGPLRDEMEAKADELGISEYVTMPGQVDHSQIPELLHQAHVFVLPTVSETFGIAIAEALGQGLPVVTTGFGGHVGFVPPAASRLADARTGTSLADAIESLSTDANRWSPAQIMTYAHDQFSEQRRRLAYGAVYEDLHVPKRRGLPSSECR